MRARLERCRRPVRHHLAGFFLAAAGVLGVVAGDAAAQSTLDHEALATQVMEAHIRPAYAKFAEKSGALGTTLAEACKRQSAEDVNSVKEAFKAAVLAWSRAEHLHFGPVTEKNRFERVVDLTGAGQPEVKLILEKRDPAVL